MANHNIRTIQETFAVNESEDRFLNIIDQASIAVFTTDLNGQVNYWSKYWLNYLGLAQPRPLVISWENIIHPDDLQNFFAVYLEATKAKQNFSLEARVKKWDESYRYFLFTGGPRYVNDNEFAGLVGTGTDINESKQIQLALQESNDQLAFAIEATQLGTWDYDPLTDKFTANNRVKEWFGLPHNEQIELGHAIATMAENDRQKVTEAIRKALDFSSGGKYDIEYTIIHPHTKKETYVRAKGRAWFNEHKIAYRFNGTLEDITEKTIARRKTARIEENIRNMVLEAPIGICVMDAPSLVSEIVNDSFVEVAGKPYEAIAGNFYWDTFAEARPYYEAALKKVVEEGLPFYANEVELMLIRHGKEENIFVTFVYSPIKDAEGNVNKVAVWVLDNTPQVIARQKIQKSTDKLNTVIIASELGTFELNLKSDVVECSERFHQIFGYVNGEKLTHAEFLNHLHPEDVLIRNEGFKKALESGTLNYQSRVICKDQSVKWIEVKGQIFYEDGNIPSVLIGTCRDFTEEKNYQRLLEEREQKFRLLADSMAQHIWTADPSGNLNYFNQSVFDYSGLTPEQLDKDGWLQIVHPDDREENMRHWINAITTGRDFIFEHRYRRHDGEYRWQLSRAIPQRDINGDIRMWVGTSTDIQEIKEQDQQKDYFIGVASHELKTPITSIKGYVQLLQTMYGDRNDPPLANALDVIARQTNALTNLVSELLDVSKIKSGKLSLNKVNFRFNNLMQEIIDELGHVHPSHTITFINEKDIVVNADRERISQVMINLLTNAIKYSPRSTEIIVTAARETDRMKVSVQDNGIGISKKDQERIFERFFRVEGNNENKYAGFGLGLSIASDIIKRHQGEISVISEPGKGATFYFDIPLGLVAGF